MMIDKIKGFAIFFNDCWWKIDQFLNTSPGWKTGPVLCRDILVIVQDNQVTAILDAVVRWCWLFLISVTVLQGIFIHSSVPNKLVV